MLPACLVAIVLLIDVSSSVMDQMYVAQRDGVAAAFEDPRLLHAIEASHGVAALVAQFDDTVGARSGWRLIRDTAAAHRFAAELRAVPRMADTRPTAIGRAIAQAHAAFAEAPCVPDARLIDISTDGFETDPHPPAPDARDAAAADGIVINAIAFPAQDGPGGGVLWVAATLLDAQDWLRRHVATGFVRVADAPADFADAFRSKVVFEITQVPAPR
jgi:hypothetical protein